MLAAEVIRQWVFGTSFSMLANILAVAFLGLSVMYFMFRF